MVAGLPPPVGGDASIGWTLEVGATVTFICAFIVISLRAWARYKYSHLDWDDYLMIFAIVRPARLLIDARSTDSKLDTSSSRNHLRLCLHKLGLRKASLLPDSGRGISRDILRSSGAGFLHRRPDLGQAFDLCLLSQINTWSEPEMAANIYLFYRCPGFCR